LAHADRAARSGLAGACGPRGSTPAAAGAPPASTTDNAPRTASPRLERVGGALHRPRAARGALGGACVPRGRHPPMPPAL